MKFSGHETFAIREGWLHKGLKLTVEEPKAWRGDRVEDELGVGRNMGKAIRHWLDVTGLVVFKRDEDPEATAFGGLIWEHDPYFAEIGTWWALHIHLVNAPDVVTTWAWFFNSYARSRFTKADCLVALRRYLELHALNRTPPSPRTLDRDLSCLLSSYARPFPAELSDPEEGRECPFRELGLLKYFSDSGTYQLDVQGKSLPPELFAYALMVAEEEQVSKDPEFLEVPLHQAGGIAGGPGRAFCLNTELIFEQAVRIEEQLPGDFEIGGLAGERILRIRNLEPLEWLRRSYQAREISYAA